jgi:L-ascorbate metabolism protein UlaG (beta-lactamase superfamily)
MRVTWWGHSTATVEDSGVRLLTDPVLTGRLAHLRRRRGPDPSASARDADAALISHLHADHLHVRSLRQLSPRTRLVVPLGAAALLARKDRGLADRCVEVQEGDEIAVGALRVRAVPAAHSGRRHPRSRYTGPALGYVIAGHRRAWFAGDTDLFNEMSRLGPLDLALLPVGGWGPTLGHGHLDPTRAVEAVRRSQPRLAIPIHWGTLWPVGLNRVRPDLFNLPGPRFASLAATAQPRTRVHVLAPGEELALEPELSALPSAASAPWPGGAGGR